MPDEDNKNCPRKWGGMLLPVQEQALTEARTELARRLPPAAGMSVEAFSEATGVSLEDAQKVLDSFIERSPEAESFLVKVKERGPAPPHPTEVLPPRSERGTARMVVLAGSSASRGMAFHFLLELLSSNTAQVIGVDPRPLKSPKLEPFLEGHDEYWEPPYDGRSDPMQDLVEKLLPEPDPPPRAFQKGSFFPPETVAKGKRGYNRPRRR